MGRASPHVVDRLSYVLDRRFQMGNDRIRLLMEGQGFYQRAEPSLRAPGGMFGPFRIEHRHIVDADEIADAALVVPAPVQGDIGIDHGDALCRRGEGGAAVHDHVAVQGDSVPRAWKIRDRDPIRRRSPALGGERGGFGLRAQEVLEPASRNPGRVRHHHDVVQGYGVVMPLVDRLGRIGRLEVHVAELHGHRMRGDADAVDVAHRLRDLRADAQIPQPARSVAAAPDDVLDAIAGAYRPPSQAAGGVQHDLGARAGKHPEWRRSPNRGGRRLDLGLAVAKFGQADYACWRLER